MYPGASILWHFRIAGPCARTQGWTLDSDMPDCVIDNQIPGKEDDIY